MANQQKTIGVIFENYSELNDLLEILEQLTLLKEIKVKIISPSKVYNDQKSENLLLKSRFKNIYFIKSLENKEFQKLSFIQKFFFVQQNKGELYSFFEDVDLVLSGVQTIFQRILYKKMHKIGITFYVYHRHLLFTSSFNGNKRLKLFNNKITKFFINILNIKEYFMGMPNIGFSDRYLVLGEVNKNFLIENGINENKIDIVGNVEYDKLSDIKLDKLNNNKINICYITGAYESNGFSHREFNQKYKINKLIKFLESNRDKYSLTIRIHPRENYEKYELLKKKTNFINLEYPSENRTILEDLMKYDLLIGGFSTAMFEAALLEKPVLFYCLNFEKDDYLDIIKHIPSSAIFYDSINQLNLSKIDVSNIIYYKSKETSKTRITNLLLKELND